jgi:hypothetical protein
MIILPTPPEENLPDGYINLELAVKRDQTEWFIAANPIWLTLTPTKKQKTGTGGYTEVNLPNRPVQKLRLISMSASQKPKITDNGIEREIDLTLLGPWNAQIDIGDWWRDGEGLFYEVLEMVPFNGYEIRALVVKKGHG